MVKLEQIIEEKREDLMNSYERNAYSFMNEHVLQTSMELDKIILNYLQEADCEMY